MFEQVGVELEKDGSIKADSQNQTTILKYLKTLLCLFPVQSAQAHIRRLFLFAVTFGPPDTLFEQVGVVLEKGGSIKVDGQNQTTILKYLVPPQNLALSVRQQA